MKKYIIVLAVIAVSLYVYATINTINGAKWSNSSILATDTITVTGIDTIDAGTYTAVAYRRPATNSGIQVESGTTAAIFSGDGVMWNDSGTTGAKTYPDSICFLGNGVMKISNGSGAITATGTAIKFDGSLDTLSDQKGLNIKKLYIGTGDSLNIAPGATVSFTGASGNVISMNGGMLNINAVTTVNSSGNVKLFSSTGTIPTITGSQPIIFRNNNSGGSIVTIDSFNNTGIVRMTTNRAETDSMKQTGVITGTGSIQINASIAGSKFIYNCLTNNLTAGAFTFGSSNATASLILIGSAATSWTFSSMVGTAFNTGTSQTISLPTTTTITGNLAIGSNQIIAAGTGTVQKTGAGNGLTAPNGETFFNFTIAKTGNVKDTIATGDTLKCTNLSITGGGMHQPATSPLEITGNYSRTSTDTNSMLGQKSIGGNFTIGAGAGPNKGGDSTLTIFNGSGNSILTINGSKIGRVRLKKSASTATLTLADNDTTKTMIDSTGTLITSGYHRFDSLAIFADSLVTTTKDTIVSNKIILSTTFKPNLAVSSRFYFDLARKDTMVNQYSSTKSAGNLSENKSGDTLTMQGAGKWDTLQIVDGGFRMTAATDTQYCKALSWTSTDPSTIIAPIVVSDSIYVAAGASITYTGLGKIISTACKLAVLNGNSVKISYPAVGPIIYSTSPLALTLGTTMTPQNVTNSGCSIVDSFNISPALLSGLSFNTATGQITGKPNIAQAKTGYKVRIYGYTNGAVYADSVYDSITVAGCLLSLSYADNPWIDTIGTIATHNATFGGCTPDSVVAITALPSGYTITKTGANIGRISWSGIGATQPSGSYTVRSYAGVKTDSAIVALSITIVRRLIISGGGRGLSTCGSLIIGTD